LCAQTQIAAGEPLLLSYGPLSNDFLLMDYGFVIPGNPHDRVALRFDMNLLNVSADRMK
jgi:histone-lysine N-methyltransferase SETD3